MFTDHEGGVRPLVIVSVTAAADGRVTFSRAERLLDDGPGARWKAMWPPDADGLLARRADAIERRHHPSVVLEGSGTYLIAGAGRVDLRCSLAKIRTLLGARCLVSQAGGGLNGALLRAGLVDELHLITVPALIGGLGTPSVMDGPPLGPDALPQRLRMVDVQVGSHGTIWAHYEVRPGPANSRGMCG